MSDTWVREGGEYEIYMKDSHLSGEWHIITHPYIILYSQRTCSAVGGLGRLLEVPHRLQEVPQRLQEEPEYYKDDPEDFKDDQDDLSKIRVYSDETFCTFFKLCRYHIDCLLCRYHINFMSLW